MNEIFAFDYDNTLAEKGGEIDGEMSRVLSKIILSGSKISIITSRTMYWLEKNNINILRMIFPDFSKLSNSDIKKIKKNFILYTGRGNEKFFPEISKGNFNFYEKISYRKHLTLEQVFKIKEIIKTELPKNILSGKNYTKQFPSRDLKGILRVIMRVEEIQSSSKDEILLNIKSKLNRIDNLSKILLEVNRNYISFSYKAKSFAIKDLLKNNSRCKIVYYGDSPLENDKPIFDLARGKMKNKLNFICVENPIHTLSLIKVHYENSLNESKNTLGILSIKEARENIEERLESYWKSMDLPFSWISPILSILEDNIDNENLAVLKIRNKFPLLGNKDSLNYSKKLIQFRKKKVKNLAKRINRFMIKDSVADIGGRTDDFMEEILKLNNSIKKAYVTDIGAFSERSKNPKIDFIVQPSLAKTPFSENSLSNIILSLTLHHMDNLDQELFIKHLVNILRNKGRLILIEDSYPEKYANNNLSQNIKKFLSFEESIKMKIISFYDWFGNKIIRGRDNIALTFNYKTMEEWKNIFERSGLKLIFLDFIGKNPKNLDLFPPKAVMVFEKKGGKFIK